MAKERIERYKSIKMHWHWGHFVIFRLHHPTGSLAFRDNQGCVRTRDGMHNEGVNQFLCSGGNSRIFRIQRHCAATKIGITFECKGTPSLCIPHQIAKTVAVIAPTLRHTGARRPKEKSRVYALTINDKEVTVCKNLPAYFRYCRDSCHHRAITKKKAGGSTSR